MDAAQTPKLMRNLYVGLEHIATFDVFVVNKSSLLKLAVEGGVRYSVGGCVAIVQIDWWAAAHYPDGCYFFNYLPFPCGRSAMIRHSRELELRKECWSGQDYI